MNLWRRIVKECPKEIHDKIDSWFRKHAFDGSVIDYMEDYLQDFLQNELATEEELRRQLLVLDDRIDAYAHRTESPYVRDISTITTSDGVSKRMEIMKRLGAGDEEIEKWRYAHRHFRVIREAYMKESEESRNTEKLISLLKEGIEAEKNGGIRSPRLSYRRKLADLYCASGLAKEEMAERMALFAEDPSRTIADYKRIRQLSPAADWPSVKEKLLGIEPELLERYGAVSEKVAKEMALYGLDKLGVDVVLAVTGNAGPTAEPGDAGVGQVYFSLATHSGIWTFGYRFEGERNEIREQAVEMMVSFGLSMFPEVETNL